MATDTKGFTTNSVDKVEESGIGHPVVADPILVSDTITNETSIATVDIQDKKELDSSRLVLISNKWTSDGIGKRTEEFFLKANRYNTHRAYNGIWKKFFHWCQKQIPIQDPEEYNVSNVLGFLIEHIRLNAQMVNGYRSAIASVYSKLHPNQPLLASQPEITMFSKAKKDTEVRIPIVNKLETWNINILILYIRKELSPSTVLNLGQLQLKVILLVYGVPYSVWLHIRQPKEISTKSIQLGVIQEEDPCFVRNLFRFMELTNQHRQHLAVDHTLFLGYLEEDTKPTTSVQPSTVGKQVQTAMEKAGVDRRYRAHSLRSATSTKAVMPGASINQTSKKTPQKYENSEIFGTYNMKTSDVGWAEINNKIINKNIINDETRQIQQSIFSNAENSTTLEDETEPMRIEIGTTFNTNVGEEEPENVVHARS
ncbi:hypothetical protein G6F37_012372 [Rhizopus arrhizus]|nr:hypothetical protein G6F38_009899 [Rhizopus arrhizus]KAG1144026.1 hypothetical protein G6F37_012372 [Rhizopus arrhizus]